MNPWLALCASATLLFVAPHAPASSCVASTFAQRLAGADVVFVGSARSIDAELATTFDVERVYKGEVSRRVVVHTDGNKYAMLAPPSRFLVYASRRPSSADGGPLELHVDACGGSALVSASAEDLNLLAQGATPHHGADAEPPPATLPPAVAETVSRPAPSANPSRDVAGTEPTAPPLPAPPDAGCAACSVGRPGPMAPLGAACFVIGALLAASRRRALPRAPRAAVRA